MNAMTQPPAPSSDPVAVPKAPVYNARDLIPDGVQAQIALDGQVYTLRITRAGKLILTK